MLEELESRERLPEVLYADSQYGRDENVTKAAARGVDVQSPVCGAPKDETKSLSVDDFAVDEATETVENCPGGCKPESSEHDGESGVTRTVMSGSDCSVCEFERECPVRKVRGQFVLEHTGKDRRLAARRAEQCTDAFREHYAIRSGGESVNSGLKRRMGLSRLRVRGSPRVRLAVLLRCAGWNLLRALSAFKKRGIRDFVGRSAALLSRLSNSGPGECPAAIFSPLYSKTSPTFRPSPLPSAA